LQLTIIDLSGNAAAATAAHDINHILEERNCKNKCNCTYIYKVVELIAPGKIYVEKKELSSKLEISMCTGYASRFLTSASISLWALVFT
jgi:hypothetical protein